MINYNIIPTKIPGTIFNSLSGGDQNLSVRYYQALDPVHYSVLNRPIKDLEVRQMVIAKAIDTLNLSINSRVYHPFLIQPIIVSEATNFNLPTEIIWDMTISHPNGWHNFRLAKILRLSGNNINTTESDFYTGSLRFIFSASRRNSNREYAIFYADYDIDSPLSYQISELMPVLSDENLDTLNLSEIDGFTGSITFLTLDFTNKSYSDLFDVLAPNTGTGNTGPAVYEIADSAPGSTDITGDFNFQSISHGTGLITEGVLNTIPSQVVSGSSILQSIGYPFDIDADLTSIDGIMIPTGLFSEFVIIAPNNDLQTGDNSNTSNPVWLSKIQRVDSGNLRLFFSTLSTDGTTVEFAFSELLLTDNAGLIKVITPTNNVISRLPSTDQQFMQGFGRGHYKLSSKWDGPNETIIDFFNAMGSLGSLTTTSFTLSSTRLSSFAVNRTSRNIPTSGQRDALEGSVGLGRRSSPLNPNANNRFVTELDEGLGEQIDLTAQPNINPNSAIERYGHVGTRTHKLIYLGIDYDLISDDQNFYDNHILPRLVILLGRNPVFGDEWYDGKRFAKYNGNSWQTP
jgi:hypothetical protein